MSTPTPPAPVAHTPIHTFGEWKITPAGGISADGEVIILRDGFNEGFGNAEGNRLIVCRAVNSHAALVEACEAAERKLRICAEHSNSIVNQTFTELADKCANALALAGGAK